MKNKILSVFFSAIVLVVHCKAVEESVDFFPKGKIDTVESIRVYKVRDGNDILILYYNDTAEYKNMGELEKYDEKSFDSRKYYVLGTSRLDSEGTRTEWSFAIDKEDEIINFRPVGVECSFYKFTFHLNILIRSKLYLTSHDK